MLLINNIELDVLKYTIDTEFSFRHGYDSIKMNVDVVKNEYNYLALKTFSRKEIQTATMIDEKLFNLVNVEITNIEVTDNIIVELRCDYLDENVDLSILRKYKLRNIYGKFSNK